jgi:hypothetical protein
VRFLHRSRGEERWRETKIHCEKKGKKVCERDKDEYMRKRSKGKITEKAKEKIDINRKTNQ